MEYSHQADRIEAALNLVEATGGDAKAKERAEDLISQAELVRAVSVVMLDQYRGRLHAQFIGH